MPGSSVEDFTSEDVKAILKLITCRFGVAALASELGVDSSLLDSFAQHVKPARPTASMLSALFDKAAEEIADRLTWTFEDIDVGIREVVLVTYATDGDLKDLSAHSWSSSVQREVMYRAAECLQAANVAVTIGLLDAEGYHAWRRENGIEENDSPTSRAAYAALHKTFPVASH